ncbi:hypothetical protein EV421DRAFT_1742328, partial [Armillaria borealis]
VNNWSIICVADVRTRDSNKAYGSVILKIIQASLLLLELDDPCLLSILMVQLAAAENYAYNALHDLQGTKIPYYFGSGQFKLLMSSSEVTRVLILECFEGLSLRQWEDTFPEDVCDENPCEMSSPAGYQDLSNKTKPLIKVLPYGIIEVNKRGFIYHVCQENILVMLSFEDPEHIVFIDFPHCLVGVTEDQIKEHGFNEVKAAISL